MLRRVLNEERAVTRAVADERPYIPYSLGDTDTVYASDLFDTIEP
jgi:hypothetical protein